MSAVTVAELSRLREADIVESHQLTDAITAEIRLALSFIIKKSQQYMNASMPEGHDLVVHHTLYIPGRARVIGIEPLLSFVGTPTEDEVDCYSMPSRSLLRVADDLFLSPTQGQLVVRDQYASLGGVAALVPITTRQLARGIVTNTRATGRDVADATAVLWDLVLMPLEDLRQQLRIELESIEP